MTAKPKSQMSDEELAIWAKSEAEVGKGFDEAVILRKIYERSDFARLERSSAPSAIRSPPHPVPHRAGAAWSR
jgi:hypothetical protein